MVIFTGVGKSGLIGQKICQTLVSTGTKAVFLSPQVGGQADSRIAAVALRRQPCRQQLGMGLEQAGGGLVREVQLPRRRGWARPAEGWGGCRLGAGGGTGQDNASVCCKEDRLC